MIKKGRVTKMLSVLTLVGAMAAALFISAPVVKASDTGEADSGNIGINATNFPDEAFRNYVSENCDTDGDGYLSAEEIAGVTKISCNSLGISDLTGVEYFTSLTKLYCDNNSIQRLDVSNNINLESLGCNSNDMDELNVSGNEKLIYLSCYSNNIQELNVSNNENLETLMCTSNNLTELDITNNKKLTYLECNSNEIAKLDLSQNTKLYYINCESTNIESLNLTNLNDLTTLKCSATKITELDISNNTKLEVLWCALNDSLSKLDVSNCENLLYLSCGYCKLEDLDLSNNEKLIRLHCSSNELEELDLSNNVELQYLECRNNNLTELDLTNNPNLVRISCDGNNIQIINVSGNTDLENLQIKVDSTVTIIENAVETISLNKSSEELEIGSTLCLTATVLPDDADMTTVMWSSSDVSVAIVDSNGLVTAVGPGTATITALAEDRSGVNATCVVKVLAPDINVSYRTHVQTFGWEKEWKSNGTMSGTSGLAKRLEGINIVVNPATACEDLDLGIQYTTHCQAYGWLPWSANGEMNGTEGEAKRLEAIMIQLTGEDADLYDVYYRVHAQTYGWLGWAKNGAPAGTAGYAKRLEGIQIVVVKKGESFNQTMGNITSARTEAFVAKEGSSPVVNSAATSNTNPVVPGTDTVNVAYRTHVQSYGWQAWKYNGQMSGTSGKSKRLEGINIELRNKDCSGDIVYTTHVQTYGWQGSETDQSKWFKNGQMAGTSGEAKRLEAICINLTGEMAEKYDIYYRVHAQSYGWLGWAKNGAPAGTAGYAKRLEGIQIVLVPKGGAAPTAYQGIVSANESAYIEK